MNVTVHGVQFVNTRSSTISSTIKWSAENTTCVPNNRCLTNKTFYTSSKGDNTYNTDDYVLNTTFSLDFNVLAYDQNYTENSLYFAYKLWFFLIDVIAILPTIFGNSLIIISLIRYKSLRKTKAFILIGNLALADLLVGLVLIPMDLVLLMANYVADNMTYCILYHCMIYTLITASVLNLFLLSLERFHAIIRPFQHNSTFTAKRIYYTMSITWIFVIVCGFMPMFVWGTGIIAFTPVCRSSTLFSNTYQIAMNTVIVTALVISFVFFIIIIRIALRKTKQKQLKCTDSPMEGSHSRHNLRRDIRHTRLMVLVSGIFIICWGPYCIISLIPNISVTVTFIRNWLASLGLINSCLNWIVYGARNKRFRRAFKNILNCSCRKQGEANITSNST